MLLGSQQGATDIGPGVSSVFVPAVEISSNDEVVGNKWKSRFIEWCRL